MITLNTNYATGEAGYTDGSVEIDLAKRLKAGESPEEILATEDSWAYTYHLSPMRENILNWFDFKKDCSILEVGSGCGALTKLLSEKAAEVTSIELTKQRAQVNYIRNQDCNNVEIIVGNFSDIRLTRKYDYIILNGVLEYAGSFTGSNQPYKTFLEKLLSYLKEDGILLIAIENRIGLKYLNGTPEDHTSLLFSGVNGYPGIDNVRTFTKAELTRLLNSVGLEYQEYFYPFPDYKLPEVIVTDETLSMLPADRAQQNYSMPRLQFFDDLEITQTLIEEGLMDKFANSFLVAASRTKQAAQSAKFIKFPQARDKAFSLRTIIEEKEGKKQVRKIAQSSEAKEHLKHIEESYQEFNNNPFTLAPVRREDNSLVFDFIEGNTLENHLIDLIRKDDLKAFKEILNAFKDKLFENSRTVDTFITPAFRAVFGDKTLSGSYHVKNQNNIDLLFSNIMDDEEGHVIDYEWIFNFPIPQEFILFRSLYYLYYQNQELRDRMSFDKLLELVENEGKPVISQQDVPAFIAWDEHFGNHYVRGKGNEPSPMRILDIYSNLRELLETVKDESSLYLDFGLGYHEPYRTKAKVTFTGNDFKIDFDLKPVKEANPDQRVIRMRWDPLEASVLLSDLKIEADGKELDYTLSEPYASKNYQIKEGILFLDDDPHLQFFGDINEVDHLSISGKMRQLSNEELLELFDTFSQEIKELESREQKALQERDTARFENLGLKDQIENLSSQVS